MMIKAVNRGQVVDFAEIGEETCVMRANMGWFGSFSGAPWRTLSIKAAQASSLASLPVSPGRAGTTDEHWPLGLLFPRQCTALLVTLLLAYLLHPSIGYYPPKVITMLYNCLKSFTQHSVRVYMGKESNSGMFTFNWITLLTPDTNTTL